MTSSAKRRERQGGFTLTLSLTLRICVHLRFRVWIRAYLADRLAAAVVDGTRGPAYKMVNGVPQETVLSPILCAGLIYKVAISLDDMSDVSDSLLGVDVAALSLGRSAVAAARFGSEPRQRGRAAFGDF